MRCETGGWESWRSVFESKDLVFGVRIRGEGDLLGCECWFITSFAGFVDVDRGLSALRDPEQLCAEGLYGNVTRDSGKFTSKVTPLLLGTICQKKVWIGDVSQSCKRLEWLLPVCSSTKLLLPCSWCFGHDLGCLGSTKCSSKELMAHRGHCFGNDGFFGHRLGTFGKCKESKQKGDGSSSRLPWSWCFSSCSSSGLSCWLVVRSAQCSITYFVFPGERPGSVERPNILSVWELIHRCVPLLKCRDRGDGDGAHQAL